MSVETGIVLSPRDQFLIAQALRYSRTRGPGVLDYTAWWITEHWTHISENTHRVIAHDVALEVELRRDEPPEERAKRRHETPNWEKLLDLAEQEQENQE